MHRPQIIAHRGASAEAPENTLSSFQLAIDLKADMIELDVQLSRDGVPIVIHDETLHRTTDDKSGKKVMDLTLKELKRLDAGSWFDVSFKGETTPTLAEVLKLNFGRTGLIIEIKGNAKNRKMLTSAVLEVLKNEDREQSPILIGSFSSLTLRAIVQCSCVYPLQGIASNQKAIERHLQLGIKSLSLDYLLLTKQNIVNYQQEGLFVTTWTVDDPLIMKEFIAHKIDGICTNHPRKLLELR
jgi:glycerophosphoryl diester phosphodiesterase